jgi:hypothetical protein
VEVRAPYSNEVGTSVLYRRLRRWRFTNETTSESVIAVRQFCRLDMWLQSSTTRDLYKSFYLPVSSVSLPPISREDSISPTHFSSISTNIRIKLPILFSPCLPSRFVSTNSIVQLQEIKNTTLKNQTENHFISNSYETNSINRKRRC